MRPFQFFRMMNCALVIAVCQVQIVCADWPQFRGRNSDGIGRGSVPIVFGPGSNEQWRVPIPPGHGSPCVVGDRICVTAYREQDRSLLVICLDRDTGRELWTRERIVDSLEKGHPSFNPASSSPSGDSECVVAYFGSYGLLCFDWEGELQWEKKMPLAKSFGGNAASPILTDDSLILYRGNYVDHYLICLEKKTGKTQWRVPHDEKFTGEMACTACPIVNEDQVICHTARGIQSYKLADGELVWSAKCATTATSTPVISGEQVIVAAWNKLGEPDLRPPFPTHESMVSKHDTNSDGLIERKEFPKLWIFHRPQGIEAAMNGAPVSWRHADQDGNGFLTQQEWSKAVEGFEKFRDGYETHGLISIPLSSRGFVGADEVRTLISDGIPEVPSPIVDDGLAYLVKNGGVLTCIDLATGERRYRMRTRGSGTHYASPLIANGHLYSFAGNGRVSVIRLYPEAEVVSVNEMGDGVYATPAIVDGTIYIRTHNAIAAYSGDAL